MSCPCFLCAQAARRLARPTPALSANEHAFLQTMYRVKRKLWKAEHPDRDDKMDEGRGT